jgi:hypothetical protein
MRSFAVLTTSRRGRELEQWMTAAAASGQQLTELDLCLYFVLQALGNRNS